MISTQFKQLLYSRSIDTWVVSEGAEVAELTDFIYQQLLGHELNNNSGKTKTTLKIVLLNLYSAHISDPKLYLRYSRDENFYGQKLRRYVGNDLKYASLVDKVIPALVRLKLIDDHKGFNDRREFGGAFQSRMRATSKLIKLFDLYGLQPWMLKNSPDREGIILKDNEKKIIRYPDIDFTHAAREQIQHINRHLEAAVIDLDLNDSEMGTLLKKLRKNDNYDLDDDEKHLSMFTSKHLYRIFSNSSFKLHGRFYGPWWQNIPRDYRQHIFINSDATVELDYSSFHPKMLHDLAEIEMAGDPYVGIGDLDRTHGKSIFNMMINAVGKDKAASRDKAIGAYMKEFRDEGMTKDAANAAIEAALERHEPIRNRFFSGFGLKLMFYDSQIANNVMLRAINEYQTVVLPVHDSFICIQEFEDKLRELMVEEYAEVMKTEVPPGVEMKDSDYYLTDEEIDEERLFKAEFGTPYDYDAPEDPKQKQRREALKIQAYAARKKFGITIEDVFTAESIEQKYAPQEVEDVLRLVDVRYWGRFCCKTRLSTDF
jgi:hypothetical protein